MAGGHVRCLPGVAAHSPSLREGTASSNPSSSSAGATQGGCFGHVRNVCPKVVDGSLPLSGRRPGVRPVTISILCPPFRDDTSLSHLEMTVSVGWGGGRARSLRHSTAPDRRPMHQRSTTPVVLPSGRQHART